MSNVLFAMILVVIVALSFTPLAIDAYYCATIAHGEWRLPGGCDWPPLFTGSQP